MFTRTYGSITSGIEGVLVNVNVNVTYSSPDFIINGFDNLAMDAAKTRIRGAIKSCGVQIPPMNIKVDFVPQRISGETARLDLAIAVGVLTGLGKISPISIVNVLYAAKLNEDGTLTGIDGIYSIVRNAKNKGIAKVFIAPENVAEALMVEDIDVYTVRNLADLLAYSSGARRLDPLSREQMLRQEVGESKDFSDFGGYVLAKRACEIAAAGGHNILINGTADFDKAMFAERINSILPEMTEEEAAEVTKAYSLGGLLADKKMINQRPYRRPKYTATVESLLGSYNSSKPGDIVLSNNGTLFLDDLHEFDQEAINKLIVPVFDGKIGVQAGLAGIFSTNVMLIGGVRPCACGYYGEGSCTCSNNDIEKYRREMPMEFISCFDVYVNISNENIREKTESSAKIRERVTTARAIQRRRLSRFGLRCNSQMNHFLIEKFCTLTPEAVAIFDTNCSWVKRSNDIYDRMLRVGRTIADLSGSVDIDALHIVEAIQFYNSY